jgi:hypothetical protein
MMHNTLLKLGTRSNMKERRCCPGEKLDSYLLISALLALFWFTSKSFGIEIISSVWKFHLVLTVRICINKSLYCIN